MFSPSCCLAKTRSFLRSFPTWMFSRQILLAMTLIVLTGCFSLTKREVQYARATKLPSELSGFMRLAQDKVQVQIIGGDNAVGEFNASERSTKPGQQYLSAYIVIHEQDMAKLVRDQKRLQELLKKKE